jgi:fucose 4-O-acetylase-like acetyltransferase
LSSGKIRGVENVSVPSKRIPYLDVAKGIGILLVVLGHNYVRISIPEMGKLIFSFHMPFFFLLSGMLFKPNYPLLVLFKRRFATLIRPYLVTITLLYSIYFFYTDIKIMTILRRVVRSLYASGNYIEWAQLWFLPHLFLLNMFVGVLFLLFYGRIKWLWLRSLFLAGMLWAGIAFLPIYYMKEVTIAGKSILLDGLPASMDLLLITATYFLIGYEIRRLVPEHFLASLWTLVISGVMLIVLNIIFPYQMDFFFRTYDSYIVNTLEALSGSVFILSLSSRIALKQNRVFAAFRYFGQITIILLIFHQPVQTTTFGHVMRLVNNNTYIAGLISFLAAVAVPVLIHQLILKNNPRVARWFGLRQPVPATLETNA